jgi:competence protein ComGC
MVDIFLLLDIILVLMVIALAISLLIAVPRDLQKKAVSALRKKTWNSRTSNGRGEDGQANAIR